MGKRRHAGKGSADPTPTSARAAGVRGRARHPLRLALVVAAALPALGCYSTWDIPTREVAKMDGYRAPAPAKVVLARDGDEVEVDRETALHFHMRGPVPEYI